MRIVTAILLLALLGLTHSADAADPSQAKEVARINNCPPKKMEVYSQSLGPDGKTIYHVDCIMPKSKDESATAASAMLISCDQNICELLRTLPPESK